jgi:hypothetical protein
MSDLQRSGCERDSRQAQCIAVFMGLTASLAGSIRRDAVLRRDSNVGATVGVKRATSEPKLVLILPAADGQLSPAPPASRASFASVGLPRRLR